MNGRRDVLRRLAQVPVKQRIEEVFKLPPHHRRHLLDCWAGWAEPGQEAPAAEWRVWLLQAGRGFGKTRAGAEWVIQLARDVPGLRVALVGATMRDVRQVMVEGESGLLTIARDHGPVNWRASDDLLEFGNDAVAHLYSAETPDALRGPQHHAAWCD